MNNLFIGNNPINSEKKEASGQFILIGDEKYYQIKNYDTMQPFFISLASDSDHWMYISSTGGLSAGRKNPDTALFPYYTDDKITESNEITGSKTIFQVQKNEKCYLWEPFSDRNNGVYSLERTISKSTIGNKLIFGEKNFDLGLTFCYCWMNADDFGWVKKSWLINDSEKLAEVTLVDGLQNILPAGIDRLTQNTYSTLVDGYKKTELIQEANLALFRMEAILVDRPEPSESLRVNTVWSFGLDNTSFLLNSKQLNDFRNGHEIVPELEAKGVRGAFFSCAKIKLDSQSTKTWYFIAELNQDAVKVNNLIDFIQNTKNIAEVIEQNIEKGTKSLQSIVAEVDGIQQTADENVMARHFANVLFNTMRGGIYSENYTIYADNFINHVKHFNIKVWNNNEPFLTKLPLSIDHSDLEKMILLQNDNNLYRLFLEYLPLTFSRRHGDPSRPWNLFNINVKDDHGNKLLSYAGNWRDIFQNWEALSLSYPGYINGIIAKFLNATTADGYNPYRVTSEGIDWEVIEPDNPWSNIGYWGDHQIIYLLKLMEVSHNHYPESLISILDKDMFAYANVPYRLKTYNEIVAEPKNSIRFDAKLHESIEKLEKNYGADAKLLLNVNDDVMLVTFTEKMLSTLLSKLSNFVPEAGIWMNTLRPEWNDANNALVGSGASMVTLYYMRRFVAFTQNLYKNASLDNYSVSDEMRSFFSELYGTFIDFENHIHNGFDNYQRRLIADELGKAGDAYRTKIYSGFSGAKQFINKSELNDFFTLTLAYIDQSIVVNKRADNLYHAYNLVAFSDKQVTVRHLYEMLEGQVAVLSSGKLTANEILDLLNALRASSLYRPDQESYILYPNKQLPLFLDKNVIPSEDVKQNQLLMKLIEMGETSIITQDKKGHFHFNADFNNASFLTIALNRLKLNSTVNVTDKERAEIMSVYEKIFDHQSFTGRSGTFYKYEGLGSIYWHMVSKLLLAVGECIKKATSEHVDIEILNQLNAHYAAIQKGIGAHKSPADYGSFPFDPYSHTPIMAGVQQPGMTGQVKEDIISRFFELGVLVENGIITIQPIMLNKTEFIQPNSQYSSAHLSFTYCTVPFIYFIDGKIGIDVVYNNGKTEYNVDYQLNDSQSKDVFKRNGEIKKIIVHFKSLN
ncbi:MAG: hypothetical protein WCG93_00095 [Paludibacter sp.]